MPRKRGDDFESTFIATRRRLQSLGTVLIPAPTTIPPHRHHAIEIISEPEPVTALLDGVNVQEVEEELGYEKLARSGEQPWLGPDPLDMNHFDLTNVRDAEIESDLTMSGPVGQAIINGPRVVHMQGDHADDEAKVDGLERVVFNAEPTASSIENPSRLDMNVNVAAGTSYTAAEGRTSWDSLEDTMVVWVASGAGVVAVAAGWSVKLASVWAAS